ncbi:hypothetical protein RHSIM_Rhsim12G0097500 [Rhododendron simsii]|uniref:Uncharacterized protein n=1 Tax=Rhododendron simsii TaxID=118357 RepID=A0A834L6S0_RHOSS|nr:hypothetical protein RHSIM_Rhsim12G0097500 [Rhododendron simsii]
MECSSVLCRTFLLLFIWCELVEDTVISFPLFLLLSLLCFLLCSICFHVGDVELMSNDALRLKFGVVAK